MENQMIIPTAEPFYFPGGRTGCLLVHGFTGAPKEMRSLGEFLHKQGHSVLGVRLAGHATDIEDMLRTKYRDWLASVEDGWHLLKPNTDRIFVMGLSMGGVLALATAARLPVAGVIAMSAPYHFPRAWAERFPWIIPMLSPFVRTMAKGEGKWFTPSIAEDHVDYPRHPVRPSYELFKLIVEMRTLLPQISAPALVIQSKDDKDVLPFNAEEIYQNIGSQQKELLWVDQANHVITRDGDTSRVFKPIAKFIQDHS